MASATVRPNAQGNDGSSKTRDRKELAILAGKFSSVEQGKVKLAELQRLLKKIDETPPATSSADAAPPTTLAAVRMLMAACHPLTGEKVVDLLIRTQQTDLLHELLSAPCRADEDLMVLLMSARAPLSLIRAVLEGPGRVLEASRQAWQCGFVSTAWPGPGVVPCAAVDKEHLLAWHAMRHADTRVLALVLAQPSVDPAVRLVDGSNLVHAAVDMPGSLCTAEHLTVLLQALRSRLSPADLMAAADRGRLPVDHLFVNHVTPDGLSPLFKVVAAADEAVQSIGVARKRASAAEAAKAETLETIHEDRSQAAQGSDVQLVSQQQGAEEVAQSSEARGGSSSGNQRSSSSDVGSSSADKSPSKSGAISNSSSSGSLLSVLAQVNAAKSRLKHLAKLCAVLVDAGADPLQELPVRSEMHSGLTRWQQLKAAALGTTGLAAHAAGAVAKKLSTGANYTSAATQRISMLGYAAAAANALDKAAASVAKVADEAGEHLMREKQGTWQDAVERACPRTPFARLHIEDPEDRPMYSKAHYAAMVKRWKDKQAAAEKKARKAAEEKKKESTKRARAAERREPHGKAADTMPENPMVVVEYEPRKDTLDTIMLRAVLRRLAIRAGTLDGVLPELQQLLQRKPKILRFLEGTFFNSKSLKATEVFAGAHESFAFSAVRFHSNNPGRLRLLLRSSEPALSEQRPWANILWLGLGAPAAVFDDLLCFCRHGPRAFSTGGKPCACYPGAQTWDVSLLRKLLDGLTRNAADTQHAVNLVNQATQHTPLSLVGNQGHIYLVADASPSMAGKDCVAINTLQADMALVLLEAGADPLVLCPYKKLVQADNMPLSAAASSSSSSSSSNSSSSSSNSQSSTGQLVTRRTTLLHLLLGECGGRLQGGVSDDVCRRLRQACLAAAASQAKEESERDKLFGDASDKDVAAAPESRVLQTVNEEGESLALAAARYYCTTGDSGPLLQLMQTGAALKQIILDMSAAINRDLGVQDAELLMDFLEQLPWANMVDVLRDVSLHEALIQQQQWQVAELLLRQAEQHVGVARAAAGSCSSNGCSSANAVQLHLTNQPAGMFSKLPCHDYVSSIRADILQSMLRLGLDTQRLNERGQPLLHAALAGRSSAIAIRSLLDSTPVDVLVWRDRLANMPLHYLAAWPNLHEPENMDLLKLMLRRCFSTFGTVSALVEKGQRNRLPHEIPLAPVPQAVIRRAWLKAEEVSTADDRAAAAAAVAEDANAFGGPQDAVLYQDSTAAAPSNEVQKAAVGRTPAAPQRSVTGASPAARQPDKVSTGTTRAAATAGPFGPHASHASAQASKPAPASAGESSQTSRAAASAAVKSLPHPEDDSSALQHSASVDRLPSLLSLLPASRQATEEAAAAGSRQQSEEWLQRHLQLSKLLTDAATGTPLHGRRGSLPEQLHAEAKQLQQELGSNLSWHSNLWEATFTRTALEQLAAMDHSMRLVVGVRLFDLVNGRWKLQGQQVPAPNAAPQQLLPRGCTQQHDMVRLAYGWRKQHDSDAFNLAMLEQRLARVKVYSTAFLGYGRIVFEVAPDYCRKYKRFVDVLRVWAVALTDEEVQATLYRIINSHSRADSVLEGVTLLRPLSDTPAEDKATCSSGVVATSAVNSSRDSTTATGVLQEPVYYAEEREEVNHDLGCSSSTWTPGPGESLPVAFAQRRPQLAAASRSSGLIRVAPPASSNLKDFTMLRLLDVTDQVMEKLLSADGLDLQHEDVPFRLSHTEQQVVEAVCCLQAPHLVMGRSGTGKTTVILHSMFMLFYKAYMATGSVRYRGVFVTASPTLKQQLDSAFVKLQMAVLPPAERGRVLAARSRQYHTLTGIPDEAFPLILSGKQYLVMLDASIGQPFLTHRHPMTKALLDDEEAAQQRALEALLDQNMQQAQAGDAAAANGELLPARARRSNSNTAKKQRELTWPVFERMWQGKYASRSKTDISLALFYQELMSFIKGSAEAVSSPTGCLSLDEYLQLGRKRSANTDVELRTKIHALLPEYNREKAHRNMYDRPDFVHSLYLRLLEDGAAACDIHHIVRDEVQDFVQGELLLDVLVLGPQKAHNILYCGDTAQTIAQGVGFRFVDVKSMLIQQYEALRRQDKTLNVHEPVQQVLDINFRSHAGILDVGNAVVAVLREVSPLTIDRLPREHAFFEGPKPLLLGAMTAQDVALLTAGRQGRKRQIEFGANQCILVRSTAEEDLSAVLPDSIRRSNALIMEVLQSKGLEFEDVLICDFLSSLANDAREWRVLLSYLQQLERHPAVLAELRQAVLQGHGEGSSFMDAMQRGGRHHQRRLLEDVPLTEEEKKALLPAEFDPALHARLVEELKRLYVAVTRARDNLVIFESNPIARAALYYYLRRLGLAMEVKTNLLYAQDSLLSNRASSNTPADWAERGISLMQQQDWSAATHCFTQAQDQLRLAYCKARQLLEDSSVPDKSEGAVLLVEAAAGAAARQEDSKLKAAGSSSSLPAITLAEFSEWLELSAGLYNKVLGRPAEAIALYCQVGKYSEAEKLCRALSEAADRLQQHDVQAALGLVTEGLSRAAASTAALQRSAAAASTSSPQRQLGRAKAPAPAQAAAVRATSLLHSACQGLLEVCSSVDLSRRQDKDGTRESVLSQQAAGTNKRQQDRAERKMIRQQQQAEALQAKARAMEQRQQLEQQERQSEQQQEEQLQYQEQQQPQPQRSRVQQQQPEPQRQQQPQQQITVKGQQQQQQQQQPPSSRLDQLQLQTSQSSASFAASRTGSASSSCSSLFSCSSHNESAAGGDTPATPSRGTDGSVPAGSAAVPAAAGPVVCGRCGLTGHLREACLTSHCTRCNKWGHTTGKCGSGCTKCGGVGHVAATCAVPRCCRCHYFGHTKTICPRLRVVPSSMAGRAGRPQQEGHTQPAAAAAPPPPPPPPPPVAAAAAALDAVCTAATVGPVVAQEGDSSSTRQAAPAPAEDRQGRDRAAQKQPQSPPLQLQPQLEQLGPGLQQQRLQGLQELPQQQQQELSQKHVATARQQTIAAIGGIAGDSTESAGHVAAGPAFAASSSGVSQQLQPQLQQQQQAVPVASKHQQRPSSGGGSADEGSDTLVSREQLMKILGQQMKALQEEKTARQAAEEMVDHLLSQMQQLQQQPQQQQQQQQSHQVAPDKVRQLEAQLEATSAQHRVEIAQLRQQQMRQMQQQTAAQAATHQAELQALRQQLTAQTRQHAAELQAAHREQQRQLAAAAANHQAELEACRVGFQRQLQQVLQQQAANHRAELAAAMQHANMPAQRRAS